MSYTAAQYAAQQRVMQMSRWSLATGLCPVCKQATIGRWPDGVRRATCGNACMERWLNVRPQRPGDSKRDIMPAISIVLDAKGETHE